MICLTMQMSYVLVFQFILVYTRMKNIGANYAIQG